MKQVYYLDRWIPEKKHTVLVCVRSISISSASLSSLLLDLSHHIVAVHDRLRNNMMCPITACMLVTFYSSSYQWYACTPVPLHWRSIASWVYQRSSCRLAARFRDQQIITQHRQYNTYIDLRSACPDYIFTPLLTQQTKAFEQCGSMANLGLGAAALARQYKPKGCLCFFVTLLFLLVSIEPCNT